jgi:polyferredoxin
MAHRSRFGPWYLTLRYATQAAYLGLALFAFVGRNFALAISLLLLTLAGGAWFCGRLCPFGSVQEWIGKAGRSLFRTRLHIPERVERLLLLSSYLLLAAGFAGLGFLAFLSGPYQSFNGLLAGNSGYLTIPAWSFLGLVLVSSLLVDRPFCRYLCVEGARHGLLSLGRVFSLRRSESACVNCGACDRACPTRVKVSNMRHVRHPQCINCLDCVRSCPVEGALTYGFVLKKKENLRKGEITYETVR